MRLFALLGLVLVGCTTSGPDGGSDPGGGGGGGGGGFDASDTISATVTMSDGNDTSSTAEIMIASTANLCSDASASPAIDRKGQHFISIELRDVSGATRTAPTAPGTYTIYANTGSEPAKAASFTVGVFDDTCQLIDSDSASGQTGSVTLTSITAGSYAGSFDVVLNTGVHLAGSFHPSACPQLATALATVDQHSCK